ncbi:MAG: CoA pyrophosphatase [Spirochaetota bacterium]|nr:CoA pyrophosphatase [Spirochaetota bacterium]
MTDENLVQQLRLCLENDTLPGFASQLKMAPDGRFTPDYDPAPAGARMAAVLILLHENEGHTRVPLIVRADNGAPHSGQIALPGGVYQEPEEYPVGTALREAREETALPPERVEVLGKITPLFIPVSNFSVCPVIGCSKGELELEPDFNEVVEIRWIDIHELHDTPRTGFFMSRSAGRHIRAPYFASSAGKIWGATAMILIELAEIIRRIRSAQQ